MTHQIKDSEEKKAFIEVNEFLTDIYTCKVAFVVMIFGDDTFIEYIKTYFRTVNTILIITIAVVVLIVTIVIIVLAIATVIFTRCVRSL